MADTSAFERFLSAFRFRRAAPATEAELAAAEEAFGQPIPKPLRSCYLVCDGSQGGGNSGLTFHSVREAAGYGAGYDFPTSEWAPLAVSDNNDSDPVCVLCRPPLIGYVVHVRHDDAPRLMYRTLDRYFQAAVAGGESLSVRNLPSDFDGPDRTDADRRVAVELTEWAATAVSEDQTNALRFACDLLPDDDVPEIVALIPLGDTYVREHVVARLGRISSDEARRALGGLRREFDAFVEECAAKLRAAGIEAAVSREHGGKSIALDGGRIGLNMPMFYAERRRPDFDAHLLERATTFLAMRR